MAGKVKHHGVTLDAAATMLDRGTRRQLRRGTYEQAKAAQLAAKIEPNDRFVDVGAGLGFTALLAASMVGERNVAAVEADPKAVAAARANFSLNERTIDLREGAVNTAEGALESGMVAFYPNAVFGASACSPRAGGTASISVRRVDLAALLAECEATALNLDAAGRECDIITAVHDFHALRVLFVTIPEQASGYERTVALMQHLFAHRFALDFADTRGQAAVFLRMA